MDTDKKTLEHAITEAITSRLSSSYDLSEKSKRRIAKSGSKLAERLIEIFEKQERKAAKKAEVLPEETDNEPKPDRTAEADED